MEEKKPVEDLASFRLDLNHWFNLGWSGGLGSCLHCFPFHSGAQFMKYLCVVPFPGHSLSGLLLPGIMVRRKVTVEVCASLHLMQTHASLQSLIESCGLTFVALPPGCFPIGSAAVSLGGLGRQCFLRGDLAIPTCSDCWEPLFSTFLVCLTRKTKEQRKIGHYLECKDFLNPFRPQLSFLSIIPIPRSIHSGDKTPPQLPIEPWSWETMQLLDGCLLPVAFSLSSSLIS